MLGAQHFDIVNFAIEINLKCRCDCPYFKIPLLRKVAPSSPGTDEPVSVLATPAILPRRLCLGSIGVRARHIAIDELTKGICLGRPTHVT